MNKNKFHSTACIVTLILAVLGSTTNPSAQEPPRQTAEEVIKIGTALVQVRAVVTDRSGKVVDNLKQEDFEVLENGKPQRIGFFSLEAISHRAPTSADANQARPIRSSAPAAVAKPQRSIVLFVDTLHLNAASLVRAKDQLKKFIDQRITDDDLVAVVTTTNSLGILSQFMRNRGMLKRAIDKISGFGQSNSFYTPFLAAKVLNDDQQALGVAVGIVT